MHLILLIAAGIFLGAVAICLVPVVVGMFILLMGVVLVGAVDLMDWLLSKIRFWG